jgi:predicted nucleotidyltransferase
MADGVRAIVDRRRAEQSAAFEAARRYAQRLASRIELETVVVFGSYARGDFNTWSDVDVLVISDQLPEAARSRMDLLWRYVDDGVSPVGWTASELQVRRQMGDPIATESDAVGMTVYAS